MIASPALCHLRKTRTLCFSGRTENNHGTLVGIVGFRAGMKHTTFGICCTQHHSIATCQPHNHLTLHLQACSHTTHLPPPPSYSKCTLLPSIPPSSSCSDSPSYQLQGTLSITTLLGASGRFFSMRSVWLRSAD